jgi:hypothetical protein
MQAGVTLWALRATARVCCCLWQWRVSGDQCARAWHIHGGRLVGSCGGGLTNLTASVASRCSLRQNACSANDAARYPRPRQGAGIFAPAASK